MFNRIKFSSSDTFALPSVHDDTDWREGVASPFIHSAIPPLTHHSISGKQNSKPYSDTRKPVATDLCHLSPRETEVLLWAARGKTAWETAQLLGLTEATIKFYIRNACQRLNTENKTHAVAVCMQCGLFRI